VSTEHSSRREREREKRGFEFGGGEQKREGE